MEAGYYFHGYADDNVVSPFLLRTAVTQLAYSLKRRLTGFSGSARLTP